MTSSVEITLRRGSEQEPLATVTIVDDSQARSKSGTRNIFCHGRLVIKYACTLQNGNRGRSEFNISIWAEERTKFPTHRHPAGTDCTRFESPLGILISLFSLSKAHKKKKMLHCTLLSVVLGVSGMFLEMLILFQIKITW